MTSQLQNDWKKERVHLLHAEDKISVDILSEFGLTENQAKVFIATTQLGTPTVSEVADMSGVRREEVYRLLPELEKIGLIERLLGKPLRLRAPNPKSAITMLVNLEREKAKDRISHLTIKSKELLQQLGHHPVKSSGDDEISADFSLLQEKESIRVEINELIRKATTQLDILFSRSDLVWLLSTQGEVLQKAAERGVKIRIMTEPSSGRDRLPKIIRRRFSEQLDVSLKYILNPSAFYLLVDRSQLIFITSGAHHLPAAVCLWTGNESLVHIASGNFEDHWHEAVHWKTVDGITLSVSPQAGAESGVTHVHRLLLYHSIETKRKVLFTFLKNHYEANYLIIYVCAEDCTEDLQKAMIDFGFDAKAISAQKQIRILNWQQWLLPDGTFSIDKAIDVWDEFYFKAQDLGFDGIAVASEMDFFLDNNIIPELEEYEKQLHDMLEGHMEMKCAYSEKSLLKMKDHLSLFARLLGYHTTLLTEDAGNIKRTTT